jgi:hypothetical protein
MPDFRRGADAIKESRERNQGGGEFVPFTPKVFWSKDGEHKEKYVLFLNPMEEIPTIDLIGYVPVKRGKFDDFEQVIARTDTAIGESKDPMVEEWGADPKENAIAVAVELDPIIEEVNGRKRPTGFEVKYNTYERRVKDEKGELTDEKEEVDVPVIGFVTQSTFNFFNLVQSFDENDGPIHQTALRIRREDKNTYSLTEAGLIDVVDLTNLIETIDGLSYLTEEEREDLVEQIEEIDSDEEAAHLIGAFLLDKRLEELCDRERYDKLFEGIDKPFKFGNKDKKDDKKSSRRRSASDRPSRRSQRRSRDDEPEAEETQEETPAEEPKEEKPKRSRSRTRAKKEEAPANEPSEEKPSGNAKLEELKARRTRSRSKSAA